jgi:predicted O-methyltransferase YrrM
MAHRRPSPDAFDAATKTRPGETIVEIGSHHGRSTIVLAAAKAPGVHLLAVDPYDEARWGGGRDAIDTFQGNLRAAGVQNDLTLARKYGAEAGREWTGGPVGLLFVDGAHDYPTVSDLSAWLPHLSPNATILMHDAYSSPGVTAAAFRHMLGHPNFVYAGSSRSLARFERAPSREC